jgi:hypothetical protein
LLQRTVGDAGLAVIDLEGSPGGPLEVTLVVPAHRRTRVRRDFAFEFAAFLRFLEGPESSGSELAIHDYIHHPQWLCFDGPLIFGLSSQRHLPDGRWVSLPKT